MIELNIQIKSLLFSFSFGFILYFIIDVFNKIVTKFKMVGKIIATLLFTLLLAVLFFIGLVYINNGYLHIYFIVLIIVGYMISKLFSHYLFTHCKKK